MALQVFLFLFVFFFLLMLALLWCLEKRGQTSGATLPTTHADDGRRENEAAVDGSRGPLFSLVPGLRLRGTEARCGGISCRWEMDEGACRSTWMEARFGKRWPVRIVQ
jgi:hypothetical protein